MSQYIVVQCQIDNPEHIVAGLLDIGFSQKDIEVYAEAQELADAYGHLGPKKANIIVRKEHLKGRTKSSWNADLGFEKSGNSYVMHVNKEESGWWKGVEPRFLQVAATCKTIEQAKRKGYRVVKKDTGSEIKLTLSKNF
jgi:hypothetical protein